MIDDRRLDALGRALDDAQQQGRADDPAQTRAEVRARLLAGVRAPATPWRRALVPALVAIAAAIVVVLGWPGRALTFEVGSDRTPGVVGAWLATPGGQSQALRFSDGSAIDLHPGSRARVAQLHDAGAQVVIEAGAALVSIEPRSDARWHIDAGPYRVDVTGTRFDVGWAPGTGVFALDLYEGSVIVHGPGIDGGRAVAAGESVRIGQADGRAAEQGIETVAVSEVAAPLAIDAPVAAPTADPAIALADDAPTPIKARPRAAARPEVSDDAPDDAPEHDWRALAERANYREALAAAEAHGFDALCESLPARELLRLADVARFARRPERATEALAATRRRFAGTDTAAMAAFERGRMAFGRGDAYGEAAKWFAVYLDERPDGSIAREATGRLMESQHEAGRDAEAARTAARYLARWPQGPDRDLAGRLAGG